MFIKSLFAAALSAIGFSAFGFDQPAYDATYTTNGITYAQRGGLGVKDFVVTNIDASAVGKVKSVNGRVGDVLLDAAAVNALPDDKDELVSNDNFKEAVATVSPPVELPAKWALANVTNANGKSVRASDVGALGNSGSQTLNQSYNGLSVAFDSKGTLYTGQYAPSKWSITKEVNDQYYYVQFLGFNGTNYPSFNLFDGESDFYIRLPRKEGTLALQGDVESKADRSELTAHTENTRNPHGVTAGQIGALSMFSPYSGSELTFSWDPDNSGIILLGNGSGTGLSVLSGVCGFYALHDGTYDWYQLPTGKSGTLAVVDDISATNPDFSNAVLAVGLNIDTNSVAVLNEISATFGGFPIKGTATTVGGLLAALAAAAAWLKKNKVGSFASVGGATATVDNGVAKLDDFFTESNSLLNGRLAYSRNATGLKDRAFNALTFDGTEYNLSTALAAVTPTASGQPRDLLIVATATAATTISFTAGTIKGDKPTIDGSGTWLITLTEYASGVWYCRQIKMEDAA